MVGQLVLTESGTITDDLDWKVKKAIDRYKTFEPEEGYYLAFSGGKDSQAIYHLAKMAGVKFDSHYNITTVDPPELLRHIKKYYPDVIRHVPENTMWELIPKKLMPPTRMVRYCCSELKEGGGAGRFVVTGVRWAESPRRKNTRSDVEYFSKYKSKKDLQLREEIFKNNDNDERRHMVENCTLQGKFILNPIIDWTDEDIWNFIKRYEIPYCELYDQGLKRLGCIGCPLQGSKGMNRDFAIWPIYKKKYIKAFDELVLERKRKNMPLKWNNGDEVMSWWLQEKSINSCMGTE